MRARARARLYIYVGHAVLPKYHLRDIKAYLKVDMFLSKNSFFAYNSSREKFFKKWHKGIDNWRNMYYNKNVDSGSYLKCLLLLDRQLK